MGTDTIFWLVATVAFGIVEAGTTALVSVWFAVGAAVTAIVSVFTDSVGVQATVFAVVSAIALAVMLPMLSGRRKKAAPVTNGSPLTIGKRGVVLRAINPGEVGRVRVDGLDWQAISNAALPQNEKVVVVGVEGASLVVAAVANQPAAQ